MWVHGKLNLYFRDVVDFIEEDEPVLAIKEEEEKEVKKKSWQKQPKKQKTVQKKKKVVQKKKTKNEENKENENAGNTAGLVVSFSFILFFSLSFRYYIYMFSLPELVKFSHPCFLLVWFYPLHVSWPPSPPDEDNKQIVKQGEEEADDENEEESEDERDKSDPDDRCKPVHFSVVCCR